jgi:hypothetical protein
MEGVIPSWQKPQNTEETIRPFYARRYNGRAMKEAVSSLQTAATKGELS